MMPELISARLHLRSWRKEDFAPYAAFYGDKEMARYVGGTRNEIDGWNAFCAMIGEWGLRGYGTFAVEELATGATAGYAAFGIPSTWRSQSYAGGSFVPFIVEAMQQKPQGAFSSGQTQISAYHLS